MAHLAILVAVEVGLGVAQYFLTPKVPKQQPIDKGKVNDLRFTIMEEGAFIPRVYGKSVRLGANLGWGTPTQEYKTSTSGSSGGKKGRGATPPTTNFSYDKSFAAYPCEGPIKSFRRIWEADAVIYNLSADPNQSNFYEAEDSFNTLAGGAVIVADAACSGGFRVDLPPGASLTFPNLVKNITETTAVVIYYKCTSAVPITIRHNGTDDPTTAPNSSGAVIPSIALNYTLTAGSSNSIKITNTSGSATISIDRLFCFPGFAAPAAGEETQTTGVVHPTLSYPSNANDPSAFYNYTPFPNGQGVSTVTLASGGQAQVEFYLGTEDQPASPTMITIEGATHTPADRGLAKVVFSHYQINNGQLGNLTFEIEPLLSDLADVLTAEYKLRGSLDSELDFTQLAGITVDGLYIDQLAPLSDTVDVLEIFYGFKVVPVDGKIRAVLLANNTTPVRTIPEHEALAYEEGTQRPNGIKIQHIEGTDLPGGIYIAYVSPDATKDFHNATQFVPFGVGPSVEANTLNFPLVSDADTAVQVGKRFLFQQHTQAHPSEFSLDPKHRDLIPTDVVTLQTAQETVDVRLTSLQAMLQGLVKAKAVPEREGLYNQVGSGQIGTGSEARPVKIPANSFLALMDVPALRDEDVGNLVWYAAMCGRGIGHWQGGYTYREVVASSGEYERLLAFPHSATIGVLVGNLPAIAYGALDAWDTTHSIVLDLFFDEDLFESRSMADVLARDVNTLVIGSGPLAEVIQFANATYTTTSFPYVRRVTLTTLLRGRRMTEAGALAGTSSGATCVLLNDAVQVFADDFDTLDTPRNFAGVSVGQALSDVLTLGAQSFTDTGQSIRGPLPNSFEAFFDNINKDALIDWKGTVASGASQQEAYELEITNSSFSTVLNGPFTVRPNQVPQYSMWNAPTTDTHVVTNMVIKGIDHGGLDFRVHDVGDDVSHLRAGTALIMLWSADIERGAIFECQIPTDRRLANITFYAADEGPTGDHAYYLTADPVSSWPAPLSGYSILASDAVASSFDAGLSYLAAPGDRLSIRVGEDGLAHFYINRIGETSVPFWTSGVPVKLGQPYFVTVAGGTSPIVEGALFGVREAHLIRPNPEWRYLKATQQVDYGSLPSVIYARVRQRSFIPGGPPSAWLNGVFTRP